MNSRLVIEGDYELVMSREAAVLPGAEFDTNQKLSAYREWFAEDTNISLIFYNDAGDVLGFVAAIACSLVGWKYINDQSQEFDEYELKGDKLLQNDQFAVSVHIYMIEKLDKSLDNFTKLAYKAIFAILKQKKLELVGVSGLAASHEANHIALHYLWRKEIKKVGEFILQDENQAKHTFIIEDQQQLSNLLKQGYSPFGKVILSSVSINEPSIIWDWWKQAQVI